MLLKMIAKGVFATTFFNDVEWSNVRLTPETVAMETARCEREIFKMKHKDPSRIIYQAQDSVVHKIFESDDCFKIIQFSKTEDYRLVFDDGRFLTAYIMVKDNDGGFQWHPWPFGKKLNRRYVVTICKSFDLSDLNYNSYMSSNWNRLDAFVT
eukprot:UN28006